mgnify:CR=1 FL=1
MPALAVYATNESVTYDTINPPRHQTRMLRFTFEIFVRAVDTYADTLDTICSEIEAAVYADTTRGGYAKDTRIGGLSVQFTGEGDQPVAVGVLQAEVIYSTTEGSPIN